MAKEEFIRVCIRQRPLFPKEIAAGHSKAWELKEEGSIKLLQQPPNGLRLKSQYSFDACFSEEVGNAHVFDKTAKDIVTDVSEGFNGCYMAYGQTGCGKTWSIMGGASDPGMLPRSVACVFDLIDDYVAPPGVERCEQVVRVDYVEIYNERVNDLLGGTPTQANENLDVKEDKNGNFYVVGLRQVEVKSLEDVMELLQNAEVKRHIARTNFNEVSSRSHTVFSISLERTETFDDGTSVSTEGEMKLVDLAGNERAAMAAEGVEDAKERQAEGQAINKSLFCLAEVISKMSKRSMLLAKARDEGKEPDKKMLAKLFVPWRESKLTRLLQKALGGNSRACLLVAVHPSSQALEISLSTLRFAERTKKITKKIEKNFLSPEQSLIAQQKELIAKLQQQLVSIASKAGIDAAADEEIAQIMGAVEGGAAAAPTGEAAKAAKKVSDEKYKEKMKQVEKLEKELQEKIERMSALIFVAKPTVTRMPKPSRDGAMAEPGETRAMGRGKRQALLRSMTLPVEAKPQRDEEPVTKERRALHRALSFLRRIEDLNSVGEDEGDKIPKIARLDTFLMDDVLRVETQKKTELPAATVPSFKAEEVDEMVGDLRRYRVEASQENRKLRQVNSDLMAKLHYMTSILGTLGLSPFITKTTAIDNGNRGILPTLAPEGKGTIDKPNLDTAVDSNGFSKMALSPLHTIPLRLRLDHIHGRIQQYRDALDSRLLTTDKALAHQETTWGAMVRIQMLKLVNSALIFRVPQTSSRLAILGLVPEEINQGIKFRDPAQFERLAELEKLKIEKKIDSFCNLLNPMEKMCLIIGMDHENVRSDIEALKGHCDERLRHITQKLQLLSLEKLAWSFHCRRIIRTIEWYGREIAHKLSMDGNEQFATVVKELERLSAELAERDVELAMARKLCSAMDGENQLLKDQLGRYHRYERCLDPENNAVLFDDEEVRSLGKETDRANLLGQILYYRQRYLDVAEREKEVSMLIEDLRTVNREIYADLQASKEREQQAQANARYYQKALALERRTFEKDLTSAAVALKTAEDKSKNLQEELQKRAIDAAHVEGVPQETEEEKEAKRKERKERKERKAGDEKDRKESKDKERRQSTRLTPAESVKSPKSLKGSKSIEKRRPSESTESKLRRPSESTESKIESRAESVSHPESPAASSPTGSPGDTKVGSKSRPSGTEKSRPSVSEKSRATSEKPRGTPEKAAKSERTRAASAASGKAASGRLGKPAKAGTRTSGAPKSK